MTHLRIVTSINRQDCNEPVQLASIIALPSMLYQLSQMDSRMKFGFTQLGGTRGRYFTTANAALRKAFAEATLLHAKTNGGDGGSVYVDVEFRRGGAVIYKTDFIVDKDGIVIQ